MRCKFLIAATAIVCFFFTKIYAQECFLEGKVSDSKSGEALPGVTISFSNGTGGVTDDGGKYNIRTIAGSYTVTFSYIGYERTERQITLHDGENLLLDVKLIQNSTELNLVVVTASKYEKNITRETVSMEVLKPDFFNNSNIVEMDEAIQKVPGLSMIDNQANVRGGSGFSYGAGSRVLVLVDGIPELTGDAGDVKWEFLPLENLDQVEIIKGASSVLYGSSALNGVINLRTRYPTSTPETRIILYQGLFENPKDKSKVWWGNRQPYLSGANFFHSHKFGQFDLVVGGSMGNEQSFHEGSYALGGRINANTRYRFRHLDGLSAGLNINYMYFQSGTYFLWANDTTGAYRALGGVDTITSTVADGKNTRMTIDPFITYFSKNGDHHDLKLRYFYTKNNNNTNQGAISNYYYGEYQFQKKFIFGMNWVIGAAGSYSGVNAELYGDHFANNLAAYTQLDKTFGKLTAVGGVRFETFRVDTAKGNSEPVFRAGLNYELAKGTFMRASFGQGYRFPSIAEKFISTSLGALRVFPNPEVQPEKGWSAELGVKQAFKISNWLGYMDLAFFAQRYSNLIEFKFGYYEPNPVPGEYDLSFLGFKSINIDNASITGSEFSIIGEGSFFGVKTGLLAGITYIRPINIDQKKYVDSILTNENTLSSESKDSLKQSEILNYRFRTTVKFNIDQSYKKISWGIEARYNSFMTNIDPFFEGNDPLIIFLFGQPTEFIPGVKNYRETHHHGDYVVDLRLSYNLNDKIRFSIIAKNAFNREYSIRPALLEAPRNYTAQVMVKI